MSTLGDKLSLKYIPFNEITYEHLKPFQVLQCNFPVLREDFASQFSPHPVEVVLVGWLDQKVVDVEVFGGILIDNTSGH